MRIDYPNKPAGEENWVTEQNRDYRGLDKDLLVYNSKYRPWYTFKSMYAVAEVLGFGWYARYKIENAATAVFIVRKVILD